MFLSEPICSIVLCVNLHRDFIGERNCHEKTANQYGAARAPGQEID